MTRVFGSVLKKVDNWVDVNDSLPESGLIVYVRYLNEKQQLCVGTMMYLEVSENTKKNGWFTRSLSGEKVAKTKWKVLQWKRKIDKEST